MIRSARHTLSHELRLGETLDFHQFGSVLTVVAAILNSRPLSVRVSPEGEYHALAPRDILFGRASRSLDAASRAISFTLDLDQDKALSYMCAQQAKIVEAWKRRWLDVVFPDMVARSKWKSASRNLRRGDVRHVKYAKELGDHDWRLAMVEDAKEDDDGVVRTMTVAFRPRNKRDTGKPYVSKTAQKLTIGVQRFAVLLAADEVLESEERDSVSSDSSPPLTSEMTLN